MRPARGSRLAVLDQSLHLVAPRREPAERPNAFAVSNFGFEPQSHHSSSCGPAFRTEMRRAEHRLGFTTGSAETATGLSAAIR
jgi:hypothetical protein